MPGAQPANPRPSNIAVFLVLALASMFLLSGAIVSQVRVVLPRGTDYDAYIRNLQYMTLVSSVLVDVGVFLFLLVGGLIALFRSDLPEGVRRTALGVSVALAITWLIVFGVFGGISYFP
jgi:hypothetical protein